MIWISLTWLRKFTEHLFLISFYEEFHKYSKFVISQQKERHEERNWETGKICFSGQAEQLIPLCHSLQGNDISLHLVSNGQILYIWYIMQLHCKNDGGILKGIHPHFPTLFLPATYVLYYCTIAYFRQ